MRRTIAMVAACLLAAVTFAPGGATARAKPDVDTKTALANGFQVAPKSTAKGKAAKPAGANPYLALLPDPGAADLSGWDRYLAAKGKERAKAKAQQRALAASPILVDEDEPAGVRGSNDTPATAQRVAGFGTNTGQNPKARVLGTLSPEPVSAEDVPANAEDDGSIPLAGETGIGETRDGITTSAVVGDGPHGSAGSGSGDFDVYKLTAQAGEGITADIDTPEGGELDSILLLIDAEGEVLATADDDGTSFDSLLSFQFTESGTYYLFVTGFLTLPDDPFDSGSGTGAQSEGPYGLTIVVGEADFDFFAVRLRKGDVLGASVSGGATLLAVYDTVPREVQGSTQDASFIFPANTPLPGGGNAVVDYVADKTGLHYVAVTSGSGGYDVTVEAYRPALESTAPPVQTLFLDFDGARLNTAIFGGPGVRTLSPFNAFLGRWGLTRADEDAVIDAVIASVTENIKSDLVASGLNGRYRIQIKNSRDHKDTFGQPNVSRIVVGGTIDESGVPTIGVAQTIDPGNFATEESALVLLDVLSDPAGDDASLNTYITPASDKVAFVGRALGNVISHEAGHFFGDWHVDQFNDIPNLMDQGGNFPVMFAVGEDNIGGTGDDPDVDFGDDTFNPGEGFTGTENTLGRIVFGVTS
jgi:hypothetical protein